MSPRYRYSRWDGSQDPWADPDEVLEGLSEDLLEVGDEKACEGCAARFLFEGGGERTHRGESLRNLRATRWAIRHNAWSTRSKRPGEGPLEGGKSTGQLDSKESSDARATPEGDSPIGGYRTTIRCRR